MPENDYSVSLKLFGREIISLTVNSESELNGSKPLMFISFIIASASIAGLLFITIAAVMYFFYGSNWLSALLPG